MVSLVMQKLYLLGVFALSALALWVVFSLLNIVDSQKAEYEAEIAAISARYEKQIKFERESFAKVQAESLKRDAEIERLRSDADSLRMQLAKTSGNKADAVPANNDRSCASCLVYRRRIAALEAALSSASDLIEERDRCAIDYNTLMKQCKGGAYGNSSNRTQAPAQ